MSIEFLKISSTFCKKIKKIKATACEKAIRKNTKIIIMKHALIQLKRNIHT